MLVIATFSRVRSATTRARAAKMAGSRLAPLLIQSRRNNRAEVIFSDEH